MKPLDEDNIEASIKNRIHNIEKDIQNKEKIDVRFIKLESIIINIFI